MTPKPQGILRTSILTVLTMIAFAANSVLCRLALSPGSIDAAGFTTIRLVSGAVTLFVIFAISHRTWHLPKSSTLFSPFMLFLYAVAFSFAYISLSAGTGALILFGTVQMTMILMALIQGERPHTFEWLGLAMALAGLVYLVSPGLNAPSPLGSLLMAIAGIAWGVYSLLGRGTLDPLAETTRNFVWAMPLSIVVSAIMLVNSHITLRGVTLAVMSGALASGVGYVIWYAALRGLTATRAAIVQLSVPVIAAWGGVLFLGEAIDLRITISAVLILGGVALALRSRDRS